MLNIQTVVPNIKLGEIIISADKRSTEKVKLTDAERIRRIVLPAGIWGNIESSIDNVRNQSLTDILREAIKKLGNERLKDMLAETPNLQSVDQSNFTISNLLKWSDETSTSRGSITFTREQAEQWFDGSMTLVALLDKWTTAGKTSEQQKVMSAFLRNRFGALAAKNHGIATLDDATKMLALIDETDAESSIGTEIIGRLDHVIKQLTAKANEATVSMGDL